MGGDLAPSLGDAKNFRGHFRKKFPFLRRKILMTFILLIHQVFLILTLFFRFSVSLLYRMSYMTFLHNKKPSFQKKFLDDTYLFTLFKLSRPSHNTSLLLKILGGPMHGPSPNLKFWGDRPLSPPIGLRPCCCY